MFDQSLSNYFTPEEVLQIKYLMESLVLSKDPTSQIFTSCDSYCWEFSMFSNEAGAEKIIAIAPVKNNIPEDYDEINHNEKWFDAFFIDNSPASAWICDENGRLLMTNKIFRELSGLKNPDKKKTLWDIFPKELADIYQANNKIVFDTNEILVTEEKFIDILGIEHISVVYKFPLNSYDNKKLLGGWSIDITERKLAEQKIFEHNLKLKEIAFLQSHEVRRPLANILGLIELIKAEYVGGKYAEVKEHLFYLSLSTKELDDIIRKVISKALE